MLNKEKVKNHKSVPKKTVETPKKSRSFMVSPKRHKPVVSKEKKNINRGGNKPVKKSNAISQWHNKDLTGKRVSVGGDKKKKSFLSGIKMPVIRKPINPSIRSVNRTDISKVDLYIQPRVMAGMAKMERCATNKGSAFLDIIKSNIGLKDFSNIENRLSLMNTKLFSDISDFILRWRSDSYQYEEECSRIEDQYNKALSTKTPNQCNNKFKESKLMFNLVNKVFDKIDVPSYNVELISNQFKINNLMREIILELITNNEDIKDELLNAYSSELQEVGDIGLLLQNIIEEIEVIYGSREYLTFILQEGVSYMMREAGAFNALKNDDNGVYMNALKYGTSFMFVEDTPKEAFPFQLKNLSLDSVVFDDYVSSIRNGIKGENARRGFLIFNYRTLEEAIYDFADSKELMEKCEWGNLPFSSEATNYADWGRDDGIYRSGQVGMYFDVISQVYVLIAGSDATVIDYKDGGMFPFKVKGKAVNPVYMTHMFSNPRSIYKKGLGHLSSQLTNVDSISDNIIIKSFIEDNSNLEVWQVREGASRSVQRKAEKASQDAISGKRGIIMSENSIGEGAEIEGSFPLRGSVQGGADKLGLITQSTDKDIISAGVNMMEVNDSPYKTANAIKSERAVALAIATKFQEINSLEWKELIKMVIEKSVKIKNNTPIPTGSLETKSKALRILMQPTFKIFKKIVKELEIEVTTEFSDTMSSKDIQKVEGLLNLIDRTDRQTPAYRTFLKKLSDLNKVSVTEEDFTIPPPPQPIQQVKQSIQ